MLFTNTQSCTKDTSTLEEKSQYLERLTKLESANRPSRTALYAHTANSDTILVELYINNNYQNMDIP